LYQCIYHNVSFYNPQTCKTLTLQGFKKKYGIESALWWRVKSLAGCPTDNVKGIKGVGEKRAIDFLLGKLNPESKAYKSILSDASVSVYFNEKLVRLPFEGAQQFKLKRDNLSEQGWISVCKQLGMKSLRQKLPFGRRKG